MKITENEANQRLDRFLRKYFKQFSEIKLSDIFAWIRKGAILVNGNKQKQDYRLRLGDEIIFNNEIKDILKKPQDLLISKQEKKYNISLNEIKNIIVYEDENWLVFNKPAGIVVHPGNKHLNDLTLNDYLQVYLGGKKGTFTPSFAFRLDKDTSGIIIAGKNYEALKYLNELIRLRKTEKYYLTIVSGKAPKYEIIDYPIFRGFNKKFGRAQSFVNFQKGLYAKTEIWTLKVIKDKFLGDISLVKVKIYTGRMHQIRVHLAHIGYPILGDIMYGYENLNKLLYDKYKISRQLLHSWKYSFFDKFKNKSIMFEATIPDDFRKLIKT